MAAQMKLTDHQLIFGKSLYEQSDLEQGGTLTYQCTKITGSIYTSGATNLNVNPSGNDNWFITTSNIISAYANKDLSDLNKIITDNITEIKFPYRNNIPIRKPPKEINEQYRFVSPANRWLDEYIITSGVVINNDNIEVIKITDSSISYIKNLIQSRYDEIDDIDTYVISGKIKQIQPTFISGYISGSTDLYNETRTLSIPETGKILSLQWPNDRYNKTIQYIDLNNYKIINLQIDPYYNLYASKCYETFKSKSNTYKTLSAIVSDWTNEFTVQEKEITKLYVPDITFKPTSKAPKYTIVDKPVTIQNLNNKSNFIIKGTTNKVTGFYKDLLINIENILKNNGYNLELYYNQYIINKSNEVERLPEKTQYTNSLLTLQNNIYFNSLSVFKTLTQGISALSSLSQIPSNLSAIVAGITDGKLNTSLEDPVYSTDFSIKIKKVK